MIGYRAKTVLSADRVLELVAAGVMLVAAAPAMAADVSWNAGNGSWFTPGNWMPNGVPIGTDAIRIGNLPGVANSTVLLAAPGSGYGSLEVNDGMTLDMNGGELVSFGEAQIFGANSRLIVRPAGGPNEHDFQGELYLGFGAFFEMVDNAPVRVFGSSESHGTISGRGSILVVSNTPFNNNGVINPSNNGGITITASQGGLANQPIDLDGNGGIGHLLLSTAFSELTVNALNLSDSFNGTITMGSGSVLNMNITDGWTADGLATFNVSSSIAGAAAQITGGHFTFGGDLNIGGSDGRLRVLANATLTSSADVFLGADDRLEFDGTTEINGGAYELSQGAWISFDGPTLVNGGTFSMTGPGLTDGVVTFAGATEWSGTLNINGAGIQSGNATVIDPTVINATTFDMDGGGGNTNWQIDHGLVINAQRIDSFLFANDFGGSMDIGSGLFSQLTVNLVGPSDSWSLSGSMNLGGIGAIPVTRVAGSRMNVTGFMTVGNGLVQVTADTTLSGAGVTIAGGSTLRMRGDTSVDAATEFVGTGSLQNGVGGVMVLHSGVSLSQVGLTNSSILRIGDGGPGIAGVDRFTMTADGAWAVDIGGNFAGTQHDLLTSTGGAATLGGTLTVSLIDLGGGTFKPVVGQEFTILTALGGVSGTFQADPVSQAGGSTYEWDVLYQPNAVVLRLANIIPPCIADFDLNGIVNVSDIFRFLTQWFAGHPSADVNQSGGSPSVEDIFVFLTAWFAGCP